MPSSSRPYQSRLLRLVLSQFQQGMERQRQAWRLAKSAVLRGAQATLYPVYVLLRTARTAGQQIGSAPGRLLNLLRDSSANTPDSVASLTAPVTNEIPPAIAADQPVIQALTLVRQWQLPPEGGPLVRWWRRGRWPGLGSPTSAALTVQGIASDVDSRSLQLIGPNNQVGSALSPTHQAYLLQQILLWIEAYWQQFVQTPELPSADTAALPGQTPQQRPRQLFPWRSTVSGSLQTVQPSDLAAAHIPNNLAPPQQSTQLPPAPAARALPAATAWEADVLESVYILHPLEQLLRWVDQALTWLERRWADLRRWLSREFSNQ